MPNIDLDNYNDYPTTKKSPKPHDPNMFQPDTKPSPQPPIVKSNIGKDGTTGRMLEETEHHGRMGHELGEHPAFPGVQI